MASRMDCACAWSRSICMCMYLAERYGAKYGVQLLEHLPREPKEAAAMVRTHMHMRMYEHLRESPRTRLL